MAAREKTMITPRFRAALETYHRKKWFPQEYPDPFGEFIDYISEGMISDLMAAWEREKRGAFLDVAHYILRILPEIQYRELFSDYIKAMSRRVQGDVLPEFNFYWIRNLNEGESQQIWNSLQKWNNQWESALSDWISALLQFKTEHSEILSAYSERLGLSIAEEEQLRSSREWFAWQFQNKTNANDYFELQRYFKLDRWKNAADWKDLPALGKSVREICSFPTFPSLKNAENPAMQLVFPILPPRRVTINYGVATGPYDAVRFLLELGKGVFYASMNPDLAAEERICGDPSLPWFWGYLYASLLADPEGVKVFLASAESIREEMAFILQCWYRQELFLSLYHQHSATDWKNVQDHYANAWEITYPLPTPAFLSLFDLSRSGDSIFRWNALMRSQQVLRHLQLKYGRKWFSNRKWIQRARDYWWEGFRFTMQDILSDLQIQEPAKYPFGPESN